MATAKRPLLPREDRLRLNALAVKARRHREERSTDPAYTQGVIDTLQWIADNTPMTPLLEEVTR